MATVADLIVQIGGDSSGLRKEIEATERQLKRSFGRDALGASEASLEILTGLTAGLGAFGVAAAISNKTGKEKHPVPTFPDSKEGKLRL